MMIPSPPFDGVESVLVIISSLTSIFFSPQVLFIYLLAVAVFSRSHCSKSLITGANILYIPTFRSRLFPTEVRHSGNALRVLANAQLHSIPSQADQN